MNTPKDEGAKSGISQLIAARYTDPERKALMNPYEKLAMAIVWQAVRDWKSATKRLKRHPDNFDARKMQEDAERFFRSRWFSILTDMDGEAFLGRLKKEA